MAWLVRTPRGRMTTYVAALCGLALGFVLYTQAAAAPYANPFWLNVSPSQESAIEMVAQLSMVREAVPSKAAGSRISVDARTGELFYDLELFRMPGVLEDNVFAIRWRSMVSGSTQVGNGALLSWETTAKYRLINPLNPNGNGGHAVDVRRPSGRIDAFVWNGTAYVAPSDVFDALTTAAGNYVLTDKWGNRVLFDANGMPQSLVDRNGNTDSLTYNGALQMTGFTDDRGKSYTITQNGDFRISTIVDPAGRTWSLGYDTSGNLTTFTTPATPDQTSGVTVTLGYDGSNRLTSVQDGRGNTVWSFAYVGGSGAIDTITIDGDVVDYAYATGRTDRTDRNGNVHRYHFSGNQVTQTDMWVASQAKYVTSYFYSGVFPWYVVLPRGNRADLDFDASGNLLELRRRTQNTSTNDASDIVHQWGYTSNFATSYTDPLGRQWAYGRDSAGNLTSVTHPTVTNPATQTASESWTYNGLGQVATHTNEEGTQTDYTYYSTGANIRLLQQVEVDSAGLSLTRSFSYDSAGNVTGETDPNGETWSRTWDALRRLVETQAPSPLSYRVQHHYDGNGNLTQTDVENIDKDGNQVSSNPWFTTTRTYTATDDLATLVEEIGASTTRTTSFDYDPNQNRIRVTKPEGNKVKWTYDERDLVASMITGEGATGESTEEYTYDDNGNRTVREDGRDNDWTRTYDLFDRLVKETDPLGHYTAYELDKNEHITKVTRKDSSDTELQRETYYFDERGRHWKTSALFKDPSQAYTDAVTVIARLKTGQVRTVTDPRGNDTVRDYDTAQRLVGVTDGMGNEWSYTLDANGNRIAWAVTEVDGGSTVTHEYEATYDEVNRRRALDEIDRTNGSNVLTTQDFFDSRSNLVFRIDARGNPTRWTFDGVGRMVKVERALTLGATINDFSTAQVTQWGFDKNDRLVSHKDDGTNESTWAYDALDRPTTMTYPDTSTVLYEYDLNGNVVETTDPSGNEVDDTFDAANRKGAPEELLARCTALLGPDGVLPMRDADRDRILERSAAMAKGALRVLAAAYRDLGPGETLDAERLERDLVFAGLAGMHDPPRPEAREAVARCRAAGIRVVMITGDHPRTAAAIARELRIAEPGDGVVTGPEIDALGDAEFAARVPTIAVYARVTAEHKLRIVRAWKAHGRTVAMTGDGVNDAPAIKGADIGVAMGLTGTEVTKEASDMVITDDNFASIVAAVEEGRGIYANIRKTLQYLLAGNTGELMLMLGAVALGLPVPLAAIQLLWINLVTDGLPALCLAVDPMDPAVMKAAPRGRAERLADRAFLSRMLLTGALTAGAAFVAYVASLRIWNDLAMARAHAFSTLVFAELLRSFGCRSDSVPLWRRGVPANRRLVGVVAAGVFIQIASPHIKWLGSLLDTPPMPLVHCIALLALSLVPAAVLELLKVIRPWRRGIAQAASEGGSHHE